MPQHPTEPNVPHDLDQLAVDLARHRAEQDGRAFFTTLRRLVPWLRRHVLEELHALEADGTLPREQFAPADVVNEVFLRAWDRFDRRPDTLPLDAWLIRLMHEAFGDPSAIPQQRQSLDDRVAAPPEFDEDQTWWDREIEDSLYPETIPLEDLIVGHLPTDQWERLDLDAKQTHLAELLNKLTHRQRRTVILWSVEGYDPPLIADIQDRDPAAVEEDLREAIDILRHELQMQGHVQQAAREFEQHVDRQGSRRKRH